MICMDRIEELLNLFEVHSLSLCLTSRVTDEWCEICSGKILPYKSWVRLQIDGGREEDAVLWRIPLANLAKLSNLYLQVVSSWSFQPILTMEIHIADHCPTSLPHFEMFEATMDSIQCFQALNLFEWPKSGHSILDCQNSFQGTGLPASVNTRVTVP